MNELGLACAHVCRDPPYIVESFVGVAHSIIGDVKKNVISPFRRLSIGINKPKPEVIELD